MHSKEGAEMRNMQDFKASISSLSDLNVDEIIDINIDVTGESNI